jgi:hypothetical protein
VKFSLSTPCKACRGSRGIASALDGGEWLVSHSGRFTSDKEPRYPLNRRLSGPQNWSGYSGKEKNLLH